MELKEVLVYKSVFQRVWKRKPVGLEEKYLGGMVESWKSCFGHTEMAGKENGSPLPISLKRNLFSKRFFNKDIEMSYSREKLSLAPCNPRLVHVPCYCPNMHILYFSLRWFASTIHNVLMALSLAIYLARLGGVRQMKKELTTSMRARNVFPVSCL